MNIHNDSTAAADDESDGIHTRTAAVVAAVWREVFGVPRVEPTDNFFDLGGHSMLAVRTASRLRTELGLRVPVRTILENPTAAGLSRLLAEAIKSEPDSVGG